MILVRRLSVVILVAVVFSICWALPVNGTPALIARADSISVPPNSSGGELTIFLTNTRDTVAGIEVLLTITRPDLITFNSAAIDTTGTVISGWGYLSYQFFDNYSRIHIVALSTWPGHPGNPMILPHPTERPLIRLPYQVKPVSDTMADRTAHILFSDSVADFGFSAPHGAYLIGLVTDTIVDSILYLCTHRDTDSVCTTWMRVFAPPYDQITIDTVIKTHYDTSYIRAVSGAVTIQPTCAALLMPGDVNNDGIVSDADLTALHAYLTAGTPLLSKPHNADVNGDSCISVTDLHLVERYLLYGPDSVAFASCAIQNPVRCCCIGTRGNVSGEIGGVVDVGDLSRLVSYLTGGSSTLPCLKAADWNGSGIVDATDLSSFVAYLTGGGTTPTNCP